MSRRNQREQEVDWDDAPPPGRPCAICAENLHFCQARGWILGDPPVAICRECAAGKPCSQQRAVEQLHAAVPFYEVDADHAPDPGRVVPLEEALALDLVSAEHHAEPGADWTIKPTLRRENLVAAAKERAAAERAARKPKRVREPGRICAGGCGAELSRNAKGDRCRQCRERDHYDKGAEQRALEQMFPPEMRLWMSERVLCAGGCGRKVPPSVVRAGGKRAVGCKETGCKVLKRDAGKPAKAAKGKRAPKLEGLALTLEFARRSLDGSDARIAELETKAAAILAEADAERRHQSVLRSMLDQLEPQQLQLEEVDRPAEELAAA